MGELGFDPIFRIDQEKALNAYGVAWMVDLVNLLLNHGILMILHAEIFHLDTI